MIVLAAAAAASIAFFAVKWWQSESFIYRHHVELWPNPDPIDGSSSYRHFPIEFAPDGSVAIATDDHDRILILQPSTGRVTRIVSGVGDQLANSLVFAKDGKSIVSAGSAGHVHVWDASTGFLLHSFRLTEKTPVVESIAGGTITTYPCNNVRVSRDGTRILCEVVDNQVFQIWNVAAGRPEITLAALGGQEVLAFSPAGNLMAISDSSHKVSLRDVRKPASRRLFDARPGWTVHASFSPDEDILATAYSQEIQLWNTRDASRLRAISLGNRVPADADITHLAFSLDGTTLAVGAEWRADTWLSIVLGGSALWRESRGCVTLWDAETGVPIAAVYPKSDVSTIALSPAADILAVGSWQGTVTLWQRWLRSPKRSRSKGTSK